MSSSRQWYIPPHGRVAPVLAEVFQPRPNGAYVPLVAEEEGSLGAF